MQAPEVVKPIPAQVVNESAAYGPFNLKDFIKAPDESKLTFSADLVSGASLPQGLICTEDGILTGIPAKESQGLYEIRVHAKNDAGEVATTFSLNIKPSIATGTTAYIDQLKSQIWEALQQNLPIPDLGEMYSRDITPTEIYYLLERWGILIIWDAYNLEPPGEKVLLNLEGISPHYNIYDRGSCLIAAPKDLYSYERTTEDGLRSARVLAREVYKRNWTIEMAGIDKMTRAAWVEMQHLGDQFGKQVEVINYTPSEEDLRLYTTQVVTRRMGQST